MLHTVMSVHKSWLAAAREVLSDVQWLSPFLKSAEKFLRRDPLLSTRNGPVFYSFRKIAGLLLGISMYRSHPGVQEAACYGLGKLAHIKYNKAAIAGAGGIRMDDLIRNQIIYDLSILCDDSSIFCVMIVVLGFEHFV